jgi:penicillin-binding protein 1C
LIADILSDNSARTLAFGAESALRFEFPVACKTGTSSDFRDNWAFGFTPEFTAGVWVGNFNGDPMHDVSGVTGAGPILHEIFEHLHEQYGTTWYARPGDIVDCLVNPITGRRLALESSNAIPSGVAGETFDMDQSSDFGFSQPVNEMFISGFLPPPQGQNDFDASGRVRLGPEYRDWFASGDNWLSSRAVVSQDQATLRIRFPLPGTTFYLDPDLPQHGSRIVLRADGSNNLQWRSDTLHFEEEAGRQIAFLTEGRHRIEVRDPRTNARDETWIEVLSR